MGRSKRRNRNHTRLKAPRMQDTSRAHHPLLLIRRQVVLWTISALLVLTVNSARAFADGNLDDYEGRLITAIEVVFENSPPDSAVQAEFAALLKIAPNTEF